MATTDVRQVCSPADTIRNFNLKTVVQKFLICNKFCKGRFRPVESVLQRRLGGCHRTETGCKCDWRTFDLEDIEQPGGHRGGSWQLRSGAMPISCRRSNDAWLGVLEMRHDESMHLNETPNAGNAKTSLAMSGRMDLAFPLTPLYPACTRWPDFPNREPGQGNAAALHLSGVPQ